MAKNIKGITIKIGGDTTELSKALKDVNSIVAKSNSELKSLNQALKLDPKNTELLSQKQEVLKNNIKATTERLNTLKEAQRQMGSYNSLTDEQKESYRALSVEISKSESALKNMNKELKSTSSINLDGLKEGLKKVGDVALDVSKKMLEISAAAGAALAGVVAAGIKSYAEYEQQLGGIEAMFDKNTAEGAEAFNKVVAKSKDAWKDLTMSTTDYYKTFTSTYTLVKNSIPDQNKAIETTNKMIQLESDLSNTFGYDIETASNAINWALKGSFNYIDNLNLGIKGTKEGFLEAAQACGYTVKSVDELTSDEILDVLTQYADKFGVLDRTANEAAGTIQGSVKSMKAAFDNFLNGSGSPQALIEAVTNVLKNLGKVITEIAPNILEGVVELIQTLLPQVIQLIIDLVPQLMDAISNLIDQLLNMLKSNTDGIAETVTTLINKVVEFITTNLPKIIEIAIILIETLAKGLIDSLPTIIDSALQLLFSIIDTIVDNLDKIIDLALELIITLAIGLVDAIPKLVEKVPEIIVKLVDKLTDPEMLGKIIKAALVLIVELARGLIIALPELLKMPKTIIENLVNKIKERVTSTDWGKIGSDIIKGICDGFGRIGQYITKKVNEVKDAITNKFKSIFGIHSPSKLMADTIGFNISAGIGEGIEEGIPDVLKDANKAMKQLNAGIESSINPIVNPSITYDTNYKMMASAVKEALQDMTIVLDDENVGKFVVKTVTNEIYS